MRVPNLERYALLEFDEIIRDGEFVYRGKIYLICKNLPDVILIQRPQHGD